MIKHQRMSRKDKDDKASQDKSDDNQKKTDDNKQPAQPKHTARNNQHQTK